MCVKVLYDDPVGREERKSMLEKNLLAMQGSQQFTVAAAGLEIGDEFDDDINIMGPYMQVRVRTCCLP